MKNILDGVVLLVLIVQVTTLPKRFKLVVYTGKRGGTNGDVYVRLRGIKGSSGKIVLDNWGNDRKSDSYDVYNFEVKKDLGPIYSLSFTHNTVFGSKWLLGDATLYHVGTYRGRKTFGPPIPFRFKRFLGDKSGASLQVKQCIGGSTWTAWSSCSHACEGTRIRKMTWYAKPITLIYGGCRGEKTEEQDCGFDC